MEDGCSKRFDLAVAFSPQNPTNGHVNDRGKLIRTEGHPQEVHPQYSSNSIPYPHSTPRSNSNVHEDFLGKGDFLGSDDGQDAVWSN